ncbi:hypothetical protein BCT47_21670 [Vibrio splendidus]|uniref:Uncharacterized protein n=1 Tax=Vibrio splendidus TaxID=29497 RepID=A0AB35N2X1_VIBSP|nr:hypothetical protein [Vibrio splendidus]MDP2502898.1 hypothetical protein [Vibrio splendidus]PMM74402.1 hypothetical protein BCT47_21670 [Vibrio splendidus]PTO81219.1 hypothetical protein CWN93_14865 [Vibrio splendidus]
MKAEQNQRRALERDLENYQKNLENLLQYCMYSPLGKEQHQDQIMRFEYLIESTQAGIDDLDTATEYTKSLNDKNPENDLYRGTVAVIGTGAEAAQIDDSTKNLLGDEPEACIQALRSIVGKSESSKTNCS